jgi:hypothetical protein
MVVSGYEIAGFLIRFFMLQSPQCPWDTKPIRFILSSEISYNIEKDLCVGKPFEIRNLLASPNLYEGVRKQIEKIE